MDPTDIDMMNEREISLDGHANLLQRLNQLRTENPENSFCDVRFNIRGKEFHCHKFALVLASPYFQTMFNENYHERNITLADVEAEAFEEILTAIYTDRFRLNSRNAYFILRASHILLLTNIVEKTVAYIGQGVAIDYLIETCLFVFDLGIQYRDQYQECIAAIASDLDDLYKTDAFKTKMRFNIFKDIISHKNIIKNNTLLSQIITEFCRNYDCRQDQLLLLLNSAKIEIQFNTQMMVDYVLRGNYPDNREHVPATASSVMDNYNVYLNTVNVKTGAKGWGIWKSKQYLHDFELVCYVDSYTGCRKVKQIGNKNYCFEYNVKLNRNVFYYFEHNEKTYLDLPSTEYFTATRYFDIEALENFIYLINERGRLYKYNCEINDWKFELQIPNRDGYSYFGFSRSTPKLVSYERLLYVVDDNENIIRIIPNVIISRDRYGNSNIPHENQLGNLHRSVNSAVCCYRNQLIVSGGWIYNKSLNEVSAYDLVASRWYKLEDMNWGRDNHLLTCDGKFLYAIENKAMTSNEKYDFGLKKWIDIPQLPQQFRITKNNEHIDLATGDLFNCSIQRCEQ